MTIVNRKIGLRKLLLGSFVVAVVAFGGMRITAAYAVALAKPAQTSAPILAQTAAPTSAPTSSATLAPTLPNMPQSRVTNGTQSSEKLLDSFLPGILRTGDPNNPQNAFVPDPATASGADPINNALNTDSTMRFSTDTSRLLWSVYPASIRGRVFFGATGDPFAIRSSTRSFGW